MWNKYLYPILYLPVHVAGSTRPWAWDKCFGSTLSHLTTGIAHWLEHFVQEWSKDPGSKPGGVSGEFKLATAC